MTDEQLAEKYELSSVKLEKIFIKLVEAKALSAFELAARCSGKPSCSYPEIKSNFRVVVREKLDFPLAVFEKDFPETRGLVLDVSTKGVGVKGLDASVGEKKFLIIPAHEVFHVGTIEMEAVCRWTSTVGIESEILAGFEILNLFQGDMEELQMLIRSLPLEDRVAMRKKLS
jgi:hypothetical protein